MKAPSLFLAMAASLAAQSFDTKCEPLHARSDVDQSGCSITGSRAASVNFIYIRPKNATLPLAAVIFQHGGGQSMTNYLSEAFILARAGVISVIPDAPAHRGTSGAETQAEVVADERHILDWLLGDPGIDAKRVAYVGHSYGAMAGAALTGAEPRFAAFILLGAVPPEPDPERDLPRARAPVLVQCARLDTDDNRRGCTEVHRLIGGPKRIVWYDDDHYFTSLEAMRDRFAWLEQHLKLQPLQPEIVKFLKR
jgi:pimeloyl-ACP methyl ester carboxylesterase